MAGDPNQAWWVQKAQGCRGIGVQGPQPKQVWPYKGAGVQGERRMGVQGCRGKRVQRHRGTPAHARQGEMGAPGGKVRGCMQYGVEGHGAQGYKGVWATGHLGEGVCGCVCTEMQHAAPQGRKSTDVFFKEKPAHSIEK